jgi:hypothetical protein
MIASDVSVIKCIIKRVRFDLYKARYDRNYASRSVCDACVGAHMDLIKTSDGRIKRPGVGSDSFYDALYPTAKFTDLSHLPPSSTPPHI